MRYVPSKLRVAAKSRLMNYWLELRPLLANQGINSAPCLVMMIGSLPADRETWAQKLYACIVTGTESQAEFVRTHYGRALWRTMVPTMKTRIMSLAAFEELRVKPMNIL